MNEVKTVLLKKIEKAISPYLDYEAYETKTRVVIKNKEDFFFSASNPPGASP